jgi:transketolase
MTILETGDATDVESVLDVAHGVPGPVYIRMLRGEIPRLFDRNLPMRLNKSRVLQTGGDITLLSSGICTEEAMRVTRVLLEKGVSIQHMHISTMKPFNDPAVLEAVARSRYGVITVENHTVIGGLGTAVAEVMAEAGLGKKLVRLGINDIYPHGASRRYLMKEYRIDALAIVEEVEKLVGSTFGIVEDDLTAVRIEPKHSEAKAEAL